MRKYKVKYRYGREWTYLEVYARNKDRAKELVLYDSCRGKRDPDEMHIKFVKKEDCRRCKPFNNKKKKC